MWCWCWFLPSIIQPSSSVFYIYIFFKCSINSVFTWLSSSSLGYTSTIFFQLPSSFIFFTPTFYIILFCLYENFQWFLCFIFYSRSQWTMNNEHKTDLLFWNHILKYFFFWIPLTLQQRHSECVCSVEVTSWKISTLLV